MSSLGLGGLHAVSWGEKRNWFIVKSPTLRMLLLMIWACTGFCLWVIFLLLLVLTFGFKKKQTMEVDGLILTKLLIFYRASVRLARCRKPCLLQGQICCLCFTIAKCLLEALLYLFNIGSVIYLEFTCSCSTFSSKISTSLFACCFSLTCLLQRQVSSFQTKNIQYLSVQEH